MQDCTHHGVHPGRACPSHHGQDQESAAQSPSPCPSGGAPPCEAGIPMPGGGAARQTEILLRGDLRPTKRVHPEQRRGGPAHCAARRAHPQNPTAGPPLVGERPDTAPPRGVTGARRTTRPYTRRPCRRCQGKLHRTVVHTNNLQERYPPGHSTEGQVGEGHGGRGPLQGRGPEQYRSNVTQGPKPPRNGHDPARTAQYTCMGTREALSDVRKHHTRVTGGKERYAGGRTTPHTPDAPRLP